MVEARVGFAADTHGSGIAYAAVRQGGQASEPIFVRVPFRVKRYPALFDREVGYAALTAVASALQERGVRRVTFAIDDADLIADVRERRSIPSALALPYVRLGCALNQFREHHVAATSTDDLTARAKAESTLYAKIA